MRQLYRLPCANMRIRIFFRCRICSTSCSPHLESAGRTPHTRPWIPSDTARPEDAVVADTAYKLNPEVTPMVKGGKSQEITENMPGSRILLSIIPNA